MPRQPPRSGFVQLDGVVTRIAGPELAYVFVGENRATYTFSPERTPGQIGNRSKRRPIVEGAYVTLVVRRVDGVVERAWAGTRTPLKRAALRRATILPRESAGFSPVSPSSGSISVQYELHPRNRPSGRISIRRAISTKLRRFGKILDTSSLWPGDLMLTRDLSPDYISTAIVSTQDEGGYGSGDACWTHAAMYLGDGSNVVEATVDGLLSGGNVRITPLEEYCTGDHVMRFRRSRMVASERTGWILCIRALSRLKNEYNVSEAVKLWFKVHIGGRLLSSRELQRNPASSAVVCSTLYADSHNEGTGQSLGEQNGVCVPAWLSGSDRFEDIESRWLALV